MATHATSGLTTMLPFFRQEPDGSESCFLVEFQGALRPRQADEVWRSMAPFFQYLPSHKVTTTPTLIGERVGMFGPRLAIETSQSSCAVEIFRAAGQPEVSRVEHFRRYAVPDDLSIAGYLAGLRDRVTETDYGTLPLSFSVPVDIPPVQVIPLLTEGLEAIRHFCKSQGLKFTEEQFRHIEHIFSLLGRNPTDVALFQLSQMWSDHCRHLLFNARLIIDGVELPYSLFDLIRDPYRVIKGTANDNILIGFHDNASAIEGFTVPLLVPADPGQPSPYILMDVSLALILSGETHNYPGHVAPYPGAATEIGGEIRDEIGCGRGSDILFAGCGRVLGSMFFPNGYRIPGEFRKGGGYVYPTDKARPVEIAVKGLQGWQDYANCFGKPCTGGFFYSGAVWRPRLDADGQVTHERIESLKPVCFGFAGGVIRHEHIEKQRPTKGMLIVQIGGPAFPIGFCGGSASSGISGSNTEAFDQNGVQRGNAEMERRFYQVLLACNAMGDRSPIISLHDQGAGGIANVLTELIEKVGGRLYIGAVRRGDPTMSDVKVWVCEYQERQGLVIQAKDLELFRAVCERENCPLEVLGEVTEDGHLVVFSESNQTKVLHQGAEPIIDLPLDLALADLPASTVEDSTPKDIRLPLTLPTDLTLAEATRLVLRRSEVGSKDWIIRGVDGSIGGLVVRNQRCGPFDLPVSDCTVSAISYDAVAGLAASFGVNPFLTTLDPAAGARMAVGEMVTNLMGVAVSSFGDIQLICNWMWPATITPPDGEVTRMVTAAKAINELLIKLKMAIIGGKDSSSMATRIKELLVKSLETIVMSSIVPVPDTSCHITPDIKHPDGSVLIHIDLANGQRRLGGSSFGQCFSQLGDTCPDLEDPNLLRRTFDVIQEMLRQGLITAGHDVSSGGLLTTVVEMCFAAGCGTTLYLPKTDNGVFADCFAEELGYVIEVPLGDKEQKVMRLLDDYQIPYTVHGVTSVNPTIKVYYGHTSQPAMEATTASLRREWERTGYQFRRLRVNPACARREWRNTAGLLAKPTYRLTFEPKPTPAIILSRIGKPKLAVVREQGSNGHPEMIAAWTRVGFEVTDIHMSDLEAGRVTSFNGFRGLVFPGGFANSDVLGAAVGWSMKIKCSERLRTIFGEFFARPDTFSFGVCNGAQLGLRCGWAPLPDLPEELQPRFTLGPLGSFNHQWIRLRIGQSPAIMLQGMEGSILGAWVANAEGYFNCDHAPEVYERIEHEHLAPLVYVDTRSRRTSALPYCPSGSPIAGVCDPTGRHLYMMPHAFDRGFDLRLWPYLPPEWNGIETSPWLRMGQNAYDWCRGHQS